MAGRLEHEKRACEALRQLARTLPLLLMMMIAFITFKSSLVPLLEGL